MRTLGIDLAVEPRKTAVSEILWTHDHAEVKTPKIKCTDKDLLGLLSGLRTGERAGVDCPFGWPIAFVEALAAHTDHQRWPGHTGWAAHYARLRLRVTDVAVDAVVRPLLARGPLSVSVDKLGATACRWAYLADQLADEGQPVDRSGAGRIVEVYPAGARAVWGLGSSRSAELLLKVAPWIRFEPGARIAYEKNEHAFDALIASLVARAASKGLTTSPGNDEERQAAAVEGWIHLPQSRSLAGLAPSGTEAERASERMS